MQMKHIIKALAPAFSSDSIRNSPVHKVSVACPAKCWVRSWSEIKVGEWGDCERACQTIYFSRSTRRNLSWLKLDWKNSGDKTALAPRGDRLDIIYSKRYHPFLTSIGQILPRAHWLQQVENAGFSCRRFKFLGRNSNTEKFWPKSKIFQCGYASWEL